MADNYATPQLRPFQDIFDEIVNKDLMDAYDDEFKHRRYDPGEHKPGLIPANEGCGWRDAYYYRDAIIWASKHGVNVFVGRPHTQEEAIDIFRKEAESFLQEELSEIDDVDIHIKRLVGGILSLINDGRGTLPPLTLTVRSDHKDIKEDDSGNYFLPDAKIIP